MADGLSLSRGNLASHSSPSRRRVGMFADLASVFRNQILVVGIGMISGVLSARLLGPEQRGVMVAAVLVAGLVAAAAHLGLPYAVIYNVSGAEDQRSGLAQTLGVCLRMLPINLLVVVSLYGLAYRFGSTTVLKGLSAHVVLASLALSIASLLQTLNVSFLSGVQDFRARNLVTFLPVFVVALIVAACWVGSLPVSAFGLVCANCAATALAIVAGWVRLRTRHGAAALLRLAPGWERRYLTYGLKFQVALIAQGLNYRLDSLILNSIAGNRDLGFYSVAVAATEVLLLIPTAVTFVLYPKVSSLTGGDRNRVTLLTLGSSLYLVVGAAAVLAVLLPWLIPLLYGGRFAPAIPAAYWLLPGMISLTVVKVLCHVLAGFGRPEYATYTTAVGLFFTVPLDFLLIPRMGIVGAAFASTVAYSAAAVAAFGFYRRCVSVAATDTLLGLARDPVVWARGRLRRELASRVGGLT